ncbi:hypothetical protein AB5I41_10270 [Sphingomonas sp. MMS24-JH45]
MPTLPAAPTGEADADWRDYGGTLSGRRYSALADITPQKNGRLELAWTQRTGDLPVAAETKEHKREYHSKFDADPHRRHALHLHAAFLRPGNRRDDRPDEVELA